ncbi:hypothetical protein D3C71_1150330 [compost metagenome]
MPGNRIGAAGAQRSVADSVEIARCIVLVGKADSGAGIVAAHTYAATGRCLGDHTRIGQGLICSGLGVGSGSVGRIGCSLRAGGGVRGRLDIILCRLQLSAVYRVSTGTVDVAIGHMDDSALRSVVADRYGIGLTGNRASPQGHRATLCGSCAIADCNAVVTCIGVSPQRNGAGPAAGAGVSIPTDCDPGDASAVIGSCSTADGNGIGCIGLCMVAKHSGSHAIGNGIGTHGCSVSAICHFDPVTHRHNVVAGGADQVSVRNPASAIQ